MKTFNKLNSIRAFERTNMSYLQTLEDYDLVCEIGTGQEAGAPVIAKALVDGHLGAPATIRRRLERLVKLGVVTKTKSKEDQRMALLYLTKDAIKAYGKLEKHIDRLG